jgi:hypothetical protein
VFWKVKPPGAQPFVFSSDQVTKASFLEAELEAARREGPVRQRTSDVREIDPWLVFSKWIEIPERHCPIGLVHAARPVGPKDSLHRLRHFLEGYMLAAITQVEIAHINVLQHVSTPDPLKTYVVACSSGPRALTKNQSEVSPIGPSTRSNG